MPRVHVTFLAAHAVPPEFFGRRRDYVDAVGAVVRGRRRRGRRQRRRLLRRRPVHRPERRAGCSPRAATSACCRGCTPAATAARRGTARRRDRLRLGRPAAHATDDDVAAPRRAGVAAVSALGRRSSGRQAAGAPAARQGRRGRARHRPQPRACVGITSMPLVIAMAVSPRDGRQRSAAGGHSGRCARAARTGPWRVVRAGWPTSCSGTPTTRVPSPGTTASAPPRLARRGSPPRPDGYGRGGMRQAARRRTSQMVAAMSSADSASSQPPSIHWNGQNRLAGW